MVFCCAVATCTSREGEVPLCRFPWVETNKDLFAQWVALCGNMSLQEESPRVIYDKRRVCVLHFCEEDFFDDKLRRGVKPKFNLPDPGKVIIDLSQKTQPPSTTMPQGKLDFLNPIYTETIVPHYIPRQKFEDHPLTFTEKIFIKKEIEDLKDEIQISLHLTDNDDRNILDDASNDIYNNIAIKQEDTLEDDKLLTVTSVADMFTPFKVKEEISTNKVSKVNTPLNTKKINIKAKLRSLDLSDHRRVMVSNITSINKRSYVKNIDIKGKLKSMTTSNLVLRNRYQKDLPYKCDVCDSYFSKKFFLAEHRLLHFQKNKFKCDKCGTRFTFEGKLSEHKWQHCSKRFVNKKRQ